MMNYCDLLRGNGFLSVNKTAIRVLGLDKAVFLAHFFDIQHYREAKGQVDPDGAFYIRAEDWDTNAGQSRHIFRKLTHWAEELGLISTNMRGIPAKKYFQVNDSKMEVFLNDLFDVNKNPRPKRKRKVATTVVPTPEKDVAEIFGYTDDQVTSAPKMEAVPLVVLPSTPKPISEVTEQSLQHPVMEMTPRQRQATLAKLTDAQRTTMDEQIDSIVEWYKTQGKPEDVTRQRAKLRIRERLLDGWRVDKLLLAVQRYVESTHQEYRDSTGNSNDTSVVSDSKYFYGLGNFFGRDCHFLNFLDEHEDWTERCLTPSGAQARREAQAYNKLKEQYQAKYGSNWEKELHKPASWAEMWRKNVEIFKSGYPDTWQKEVYGDGEIPIDDILCPGGKIYVRDYDENTVYCQQCPQREECLNELEHHMLSKDIVIDQYASKKLE